jgi:hypothetical protein
MSKLQHHISVLHTIDCVKAKIAANSLERFRRAAMEFMALAIKELDLRPGNILRYRYGLHTSSGRALSLDEVWTVSKEAT